MYLIFFLPFDRFNLPTDIFAGGGIWSQLLDNLVDMFQRCCNGSEAHIIKKNLRFLSQCYCNISSNRYIKQLLNTIAFIVQMNDDLDLRFTGSLKHNTEENADYLRPFFH